MTLSVNRQHPTSPNVTVRATSGSVMAEVTEHHQHVRYFHTQLGQLLDSMEAEAKEAAST